MCNEALIVIFPTDEGFHLSGFPTVTLPRGNESRKRSGLCTLLTRVGGSAGAVQKCRSTNYRAAAREDGALGSRALDWAGNNKQAVDLYSRAKGASLFQDGLSQQKSLRGFPLQQGLILFWRFGSHRCLRHQAGHHGPRITKEGIDRPAIVMSAPSRM